MDALIIFAASGQDVMATQTLLLLSFCLLFFCFITETHITYNKIHLLVLEMEAGGLDYKAVDLETTD